MHELSMALEVCRIAEVHAAPSPAHHIIEVGLEVGDDCGLEIANFEFCLEALLSHEPFRNARAAIRRVPGNVLQLSYLEVDDGSPHH